MLLGWMRGLMGRLKRDEEFNNYLLKVRLAHKQKRNFMKLIDKI